MCLCMDKQISELAVKPSKRYIQISRERERYSAVELHRDVNTGR